MNQEREQIARIILGPKSAWNFGQAKTWNLTEWAQYPETTRALAKADAILALRSGGEGWRLVPVEPPVELLVSMAVRDDHGLGVPGYYDQEFFGAERIPHAARMEAAISTMRKLYEEVVGEGFYKPEHADRYRAMLSAAPSPSTHGEG